MAPHRWVQTPWQLPQRPNSSPASLDPSPVNRTQVAAQDMLWERQGSAQRSWSMITIILPPTISALRKSDLFWCYISKFRNKIFFIAFSLNPKIIISSVFHSLEIWRCPHKKPVQYSKEMLPLIRNKRTLLIENSFSGVEEFLELL